jgi:CRISPR-associated protein Cas1
MLSFVYDIADLYKAELTVPLSFEMTAAGTEAMESRVRRACRDRFYTSRILQRVVPDIEKALSVVNVETTEGGDYDSDMALPGDLWDSESGTASGGVNWADKLEGGDESWS